MNYPGTFETERLLIRPLTEEDAIQWLPFMTSKKALEFFPVFATGNPIKNAHAWLERQLKRYRENRFGLEALIDKQTGSFLGQCGLLEQELDGAVELEIGYSLLPAHWGKGYATESALFFRDWAFEQGLRPSIISVIDRNNTASQKVAERVGMVWEKEVSWNKMDVFVYRIREEVWKTSKT